ncbi:Uncharacterized [Moorella glycerini]|uniref:Uncharacterized protein n=1 Tax=Neomoorella stamsii TaxID=1266720 RepID=A0A9X7P4X3_9FIRM|nr:MULTISPECIES: hypothetical protein [Moorella]PRR69632.1 hypothetical protein MOST_30540 [Moorella stamsii]CEP67844.1 Uncharacterized [Moorella glycerini]
MPDKLNNMEVVVEGKIDLDKLAWLLVPGFMGWLKEKGGSESDAGLDRQTGCSPGTSYLR